MGGGRWESEERSDVQARSTLTSTAPKARSRSREVATLDEVPRISLRVSSKLIVCQSFTHDPKIVVWSKSSESSWTSFGIKALKV